jgi:nitrile hydratase subunit beta
MVNGAHDLGGMDRLGPVVVDKDEPVFRAEWEKLAFATFAGCFRAGLFGVDQFRLGIELMHPAEYLLSNYYEHWVHTAEHYGVKAGVIDPEELERRTRHYLENPDAPLPERTDPELLAFVDAAVKGGAPPRRESDKIAQFKVGDVVTVLSSHPLNHTRRARYVRGRTGTITAAHGTFIYPDSAGNGGGDAPEHLYTMVFAASELWGEDVAEPNCLVYYDVWEPYIVHAG